MTVLDSLKQFVISQKTSVTVWVAYSGGLDSHVLLHGLAEIRKQTPFHLKALHINHGLSVNASQWSLHCKNICEQLDIPFHVQALELSLQTGESLEELARTARYQALTAFLKVGDLLVSAHHQDDQAETLLLQLLRGAGPKGLSAMPETKTLGLGFHVRPLLDLSRTDLEKYARHHQLSWIEDESNANAQFSRNFMRLHVLPLLKQHWPSATKTLARSAKQCAQTHTLVESYLQAELVRCAGAVPGTLSVSALRALSCNEQAHLLRLWLQEQGASLPSAAKIAHIQHDVLEAADDKMPCVRWGQWEVRRFRQAIFVLKVRRVVSDSQQEWVWHDLSQPLVLGELGALSIVCRTLPQGVWTVRFRQAGDKCQLAGRRHRHSLKNLLQEWGVPTWERDVTPLVFVDDYLVSAVNYYADQEVMRELGVLDLVFLRI